MRCRIRTPSERIHQVQHGWQWWKTAGSEAERADPGVTAQKSKGEKPEGKPRDAVDAQKKFKKTEEDRHKSHFNRAKDRIGLVPRRRQPQPLLHVVVDDELHPDDADDVEESGLQAPKERSFLADLL